MIAVVCEALESIIKKTTARLDDERAEPPACG